ncbi:MAG: hypothetical protein JW958_04745 [Candidatus Eisenbacteria bacterium]|nr:hypothetical protein [Candidatus Eisenbacteria bacterium]
MKRFTLLPVLLLAAHVAFAAGGGPSGEEAYNTKSYDDYEKPAACRSCHTDLFRQWEQSMMAQAFTHHWDEIEYFGLAVEHAKRDPIAAKAEPGCNGCHTPIAYLAGDTPPPRPEKNSRANESVSCDVCHTVSGYAGDTPFNFNWISTPGRTKYGPKPGRVSPHHDTEYNPFLRQAEFCGTCHNEMSPYGAWVKATQIEWAAGPYGADGVPCQRCHEPRAWGKSASMVEADSVAQHLFHGAHDPGKVAGAVELRMHPEEREVPYDGIAVVKVQLFNGKAGHKIPTGSVEDRIVWLHVTAEDEEGRTWHLPVDPKGFSGEEYTIAADVLAYQDMAVPLDDPDFPGVQRDGVPFGDRIFRMPYFDPQGRMTIMQWNTKSFGVDYRIGPRETKIETFTWEIPEDLSPGRVTFHAELNFQKLVKPVADLLNVPADESAVVPINHAETWIEVYD